MSGRGKSVLELGTGWSSTLPVAAGILEVEEGNRMQRVAMVMPCANQHRGVDCVRRWLSLGYDVGIFVDSDLVLNATFTIRGEYRGYWHAANQLAKEAVARGGKVVVLAGDDMDPDPQYSADQLYHQFYERFPSGYGVMQPCGDPQGRDVAGVPAAARICGSGWYGRDWVNRAYGGNGPTYAGYWHYFGDEEIRWVAEAQHALWMRPDLEQHHHHWSYGHVEITIYQKRNQLMWDSDRRLFTERRAAAFPASAPSESDRTAQIPVFDKATGP